MIRELSTDDVAIYRDLRLQALREHSEAFSTSAEDFEQRSLESIAQRLEPSPTQFTLGAFLGEAYVGSLTFVQEGRTKLRHRGHIYGMYVAPKARRQGVGQTLLQETILRANRMTQLKTIVLSVTVTNISAIKLYEATGFVKAWLEPRVIKIGEKYSDSLGMVLELSDR